MSSFTTRIAFLLVAVMLGASLSACGDSSDEQGSKAETASKTASGEKPAESGEKPAGSGADRQAGETADEPLPGPPPARKPVEVPAEGDRSLQTYGESAPEEDYLAVDRTVRRFYLALAERDLPAMCDLLAKGMKDMLSQLASRAAKGSGDVGCVDALDGFTRARKGGPRKVRVADARIDGDEGFAFADIPGQGLSAVAIAREDGVWKVGNMGAVPLN